MYALFPHTALDSNYIKKSNLIITVGWLRHWHFEILFWVISFASIISPCTPLSKGNVNNVINFMVSRILLCYSGLLYWLQDEVSARYQWVFFFLFFYSITIMSVLITWERPKCTDKLGTRGTQRLKVSDEYPQQLHGINMALYENNHNSITYNKKTARVWLE